MYRLSVTLLRFVATVEKGWSLAYEIRFTNDQACPGDSHLYLLHHLPDLHVHRLVIQQLLLRFSSYSGLSEEQKFERRDGGVLHQRVFNIYAGKANADWDV